MTSSPRDFSRLRVVQLNRRVPLAVELAPDAAARADLAARLGLSDLPALRLKGTLRAEGADSWTFEGRMTATVVQPCVVTLAPVHTRLDEDVQRSWSPHLTEPAAEAGEIEMRDDAVEPLGQTIDLAALLEEELSLALPLYPRADGASLAPPAVDAPPEDERRRPFANLDALLKARGPSGGTEGGEGGPKGGGVN